MARSRASGNSSVVPPGNVESVKKSTPDEVQISRRGRADLPARKPRTLPRRILLGSPAESRRAWADVSCVIAAFSCSSWPDAPAETGAAPRIIASTSDEARLVQVPTCARRSPTGNIAEPVNRMCW